MHAACHLKKTLCDSKNSPSPLACRRTVSMYLPMSLSFILLVQLLCGSHLYLPITRTPRSSVVLVPSDDDNARCKSSQGRYLCMYLSLSLKENNPRLKTAPASALSLGSPLPFTSACARPVPLTLTLTLSHSHLVIRFYQSASPRWHRHRHRASVAAVAWRAESGIESQTKARDQTGAFCRPLFL